MGGNEGKFREPVTLWMEKEQFFLNNSKVYFC